MKVTDLRRKLIAALAAGGMLAPAAAYAANLNTNLVLNPDFESVDATTGVNGGVHVVNWGDGTRTGFAYNYAQNYDFGGPLAGGGSLYFTTNQSGGTGADITAPGVVMQSIDVSTGPTATAIAAGTAGFNLSAFFTSYVNQQGVSNGDIGNIHLRFVNAANDSLGTSILSDPTPTAVWKQSTSSGAIPTGTAKVQISLYGTPVSGGPDGYIDNLDFQVTNVIIEPTLSITVNRTTGAISLKNQTGSAKNLASYSITSAFEGLAPANWQSIADNYDSGSPGPNQVDAAHAWTELTTAASHGDLSEADLASGDGASLANGRSVAIGNAGAWIRSFREDLVFEYVSGGAIVQGLVNYSGGPGAIQGDLNLDGAINAADWAIVRTNQNANLSALSLAEAYRQGDFTSDRKNDHADFTAFKALYDSANGVGAFVAMVSNVPEPSSFSLIAAAGCLIAARRRHFAVQQLKAAARQASWTHRAKSRSNEQSRFPMVHPPAYLERTPARSGASFLAALLSLTLATAPASAATSIANSLTGFTGDSSLGTTQTALGGVGLGFSTTSNSVEYPEGSGLTVDPSIQFDSTGASFGISQGGDGGRNFVRTTQTDYANVSFVAEVTWVTTGMSFQAGYFGLGSAEFGSFRIADWGTQNSAIQLFLEVDPLDPNVSVLTNNNGSSTFAGTPALGMDSGTNRLRMSYDWFQKKATFAIDLNYAGGPFTADVTTSSLSTLALYGASGWPTEPARVYFGGDDGSTFKDLQLTVSTPAMRLGDFNMDGNITTADWAILRNNQLADLSGKTISEAYFLGDVTADLANNYADFVLFKDLYDGANGVGSFAAMAASVPEPATMALLALAGLVLRPAASRVTRRR